MNKISWLDDTAMPYPQFKSLDDLHAYEQALNERRVLRQQLDDAVNHLRKMAQDFSTGADWRFSKQVFVCQSLRQRICEWDQKWYGSK